MKRNTMLKLGLGISTLATIIYAQENGTVFPGGGIATWSAQTNTPEWNQALRVKYSRQGCSDAPATCMAFIGRVAQSINVKITLHVPLNTTTTAAYASEYSQLSLNAPYLVEFSIDDFVRQYRALFGSGQPAVLIDQIISNVKSANPDLAFGATIYEDELTSPYLQDADLPASVRARFDYVHLFIHYRENGPKYPSYVARAKRLFPNARIIAGSYAYDRRAFLPCAPKGKPCTAEQDLELFKQSLIIQASEVQRGIVDHIEFYPGYFGAEETWPSWSDSRECAPGDVAACVANTKAMREAALAILNGSTAAPSWFQLSPSGRLPAARYGHSAVMDSASHRMIVFGGNSDTDPLNDTWILTNAGGKSGQPAWINVRTANAPPAANYSAGMYDPASNRMVIYGGAASTDV